MLRLSFSTLRGRRTSMLGAFVALALGAALITAVVEIMLAGSDAGKAHIERFRAAPIVVSGAPEARSVTVVAGEREVEADPNPQRRYLDPALVDRVAAAPGVTRVVADRTFEVRASAGAPLDSPSPLVGHGWASAAVTPFKLREGRAPADPYEIVLPTGAAASLGETVRLATPAGVADYRVVGIAAGPGGRGPSFETPLFFSDREARGLQPRVDAVAVWPASAAASVGRAVGASEGEVVALTGARRRVAEPDPERDAVAGAVVLLGIAAMTVAFVAIFVVSMTFAFAVALRQRELALLRAIGATPGQVRRMLVAESALLALLASAVGAVLSLPLAPVLVRWLAGEGLWPESLSVSPHLWTGVAGAVSMVLVALAGTWTAARRASRVRPQEALQESGVDRVRLGVVRVAFGLLAFGGAGASALAASASGSVDVALPVALAQAVGLIVGLTMFAPVIAPRAVALLLAPWMRKRGATAMLVRAHARAGVRRTTSTAAPVLVAVGLAAGLGSLVFSLDSSQRTADRARVASDARVVTAGLGAGLTDSDLAALRAIPGARTAATLEADVRTQPDMTPYTVSAFDPGGEGLLMRFRVMRGSLNDLRDDTIAIGEVMAKATGARVGSDLTLWLPDGTRRRLRVVALVADGLGRTGAYMPRATMSGHAGPVAATTAYVRTTTAAGSAGLRNAAAQRGLTVAAPGTQRAADPTDSSRMNRLALIVVLGAALLYVVIGVANTVGVATAARAGELALLRLTGATPRQVTQLVTMEAFVVAATGGLLGGVVAVAVYAALKYGGSSLEGPAVVDVPWELLLALTAICAAAAVIAAVLTVTATQRRPAHLVAAGAQGA